MFRHPLTDDQAVSGHGCTKAQCLPIAAAGTLQQLPHEFKKTVETGIWFRLLNIHVNLGWDEPYMRVKTSAELRTSGDLFLTPEQAWGTHSSHLSEATDQVDFFVDKNWDDDLKQYRIDPEIVKQIAPPAKQN